MSEKLSIVVPIYNEEENIPVLHAEISAALHNKYEYEIIFVDDGSTDASLEKCIALSDEKTRVISFRKNFGQTAAMLAGINHSSGSIIVTMDGDLQNDPADIPKLVEQIESGYDVASGWRKMRKDPFLKHIASRGANFLRHVILKDTVNDSGCSLKAYRKECFEDFDMYGEMHRFIPAILKMKGFSICEVVVNHRPRKFGNTKYGFARILKGLMDLFILKFWFDFSARPIHFFGSAGFVFVSAGIVINSYLSFIKLYFGEDIGNRPLLLFGILCMILGIQIFAIGILADIMIKIYFKDKPSYSIKKMY